MIKAQNKKLLPSPAEVSITKFCRQCRHNSIFISLISYSTHMVCSDIRNNNSILFSKPLLQRARRPFLNQRSIVLHLKTIRLDYDSFLFIKHKSSFFGLFLQSCHLFFFYLLNTLIRSWKIFRHGSSNLLLILKLRLLLRFCLPQQNR